jgi:hypothetical protein
MLWITSRSRPAISVRFDNTGYKGNATIAATCIWTDSSASFSSSNPECEGWIARYGGDIFSALSKIFVLYAPRTLKATLRALLPAAQSQLTFESDPFRGRAAHCR